jgi:hypothetical protein
MNGEWYICIRQTEIYLLSSKRAEFQNGRERRNIFSYFPLGKRKNYIKESFDPVTWPCLENIPARVCSH